MISTDVDGSCRVDVLNPLSVVVILISDKIAPIVLRVLLSVHTTTLLWQECLNPTCFSELYFIFLRLKVSKLGMPSMLINICSVFSTHSFYELEAIRNQLHFGSQESPCLHDLGSFVIGVSTGCVSNVKLIGKRPDETLFKVYNKVAKRRQMRDSRLSHSSLA